MALPLVRSWLRAGQAVFEINHPLAVVQGRLEMLRAIPDMPADEVAERGLHALHAIVRRVAQFVQLLEGGGATVPTPEPVEQGRRVPSMRPSLGWGVAWDAFMSR